MRKNNHSSVKLEIAASQNIEEKNHWLNALSGELTKSFFPYDFNRVSTGAVRMESVTAALPAELCSRLAGMSGGADVRLFILLTAGLTVLLNKYTHHTDIIVGTSIYRQEGEPGAGFVNTVLPLRSGLEDGITFKELLMKVGKTLLEANKYQNYPMKKLLRLLDMAPPDTAGVEDFPLFDAAVLLENIHNMDYLEGIPLGTVFLFNRTGEGEVSVDLTLRYNSLRYRKSTAARIVSHFITLLTNAVSSVDTPVKDIDIFTEEERNEILFGFNDTKRPYAGEKTMYGLFREQAARTPGNTAVIYGGERLTYEQLDRRTDRLALELQEKGLVPNRFAAVIIDRSMEMVIAVMAVLKAGGAFVPLEPYLPDSRIITCLSALDAEWVLTGRSQVGKIDGIREQWDGVKHVFCLDDDAAAPGNEESPGTVPVSAVTSDDMAYVIFTSGTTGTPKGVVVRHKPVINLVEWVNGTFNVGGEDTLLFVVSLSFDLSIYDIFGILASGGAVRVAGSDDIRSPERLLDIIFQEGITFWDSAPASLQLLVPYLGRVPETPAYAGKSKLRLVFLSGDWIPVTMPDILKDTFPGVEVIALGGATEAVVWSNYFPVGEVDPDWLSIPYGKPIQNAHYYILDRFLIPCPIGTAGDLYIGGECLASGYFNDEALTSGKFMDNPFVPEGKIYKTGDLARWFPDGNMEFLGRGDSQVKVRGFRIELGEIETQLLKHRDIKEAVVIARGEAREDRWLCAYYTSDLSPGAGELSDYLSGVLPHYMVPPYFVKLDRLPLTPNGKVDRKRLPEPQLDAVDAYAAPANEIEEELTAIWSDVLKIKKDLISVNANFFDLGGHSLKATNLVVLIHEKMNVALPLADIFKAPTIRELAHLVKGAAAETYSAIEAVEKKQYYAASSAQKRLYFVQKREPEITVFNIPGYLEFTEEKGPERVRQILDRLVRRHRSLRTSFHMIDGRVVQRIHDHVDFEPEYQETVQRDRLLETLARPFDLSLAPLLRAIIVRQDRDRYVLHIDVHHIVTDGVSVEILLEEFTALSNGADLPPLRVQYNDFAEWQARFLESGKMNRQLEYWSGVLDGELPVLNMPTDFPRPHLQRFAGENHIFSIGKEMRERIRELEAASGATLFMILLSVLYVLLMKYSGREDILVGSPTAGRHHADLLRVVGMFVNLLPLRGLPHNEKTFEELLKEVNTNCIQAFENQDVPFEELVDRLMPKPDPSRHPLFDVCFFLQNFAETRDAGEGNSASRDNATHALQFDMELGAFEVTGGIGFSLGYSTALFKRAAIEKMAERYLQILEQAVENPGIKLKEIAVTTRLLALRTDNVPADEEGDFGL